MFFAVFQEHVVLFSLHVRLSIVEHAADVPDDLDGLSLHFSFFHLHVFLFAFDVHSSSLVIALHFEAPSAVESPAPPESDSDGLTPHLSCFHSHPRRRPRGSRARSRGGP